MKIVSNLEVDGNFNIGVTSATISSAGNAFFQTVSGTHFGNLSGTASNSVQLLNTQPFSIVGDISASPISFNGTSAVILNSVLSATGATPGIYGTNTSVSQFQVDSKGRIISASSVSIQFPGGGAGGSVSSVGISSTTLAVGLSPVTTSGNISVNLSATGVSAGSYGSVNNIPVISLDSYGRVISASTISSVFYPASTYYSITTSQIISSSVTLTSILPGMPSFSVLTQSPGNVIYIKGSGNISWANLANTLTWTFVDGFNTLVSFGVSGNDISNSIINTLYNWEIDAKLEPQTSAGTSATVILVGTMKFYDSSTFTLINLNESATVNTTIQNSLNISVQWSNAATNNKVTVNEMTVSQASSNSGIIYTGVGVSSVGITSTTLTITGSPVTTAGYINVDLNTFGTSGTFTKVTTDIYGRVVSGATLTSGDIPTLSYLPTSSTLYTYFSGLSANVQNQLLYLSANGGSGGSVSSVGIASTTLTISNTPITTSGTISVNLLSFGTSGTYTKISSDAYGRVISGTTLTSADIPVLPYYPSSASISWNNISGSPTTLSGYGITSADPLFNSKYAQISAIPSLSGLGLYLPLSGGVLTGNISGPNISATNFFEGGQLLVNRYVTVSGDIMTGGLTTPFLSATSISGISQTLTSTVDSPLTINMSATGGFIHPIIALNTGMSATVGNRFNFDFGLQEATNNAANFGFCYQGNGSSNNFITFGVYGTNDLLTISANKTATFLGPVYGSSGIGYNIGSGGQIVQATNKATGVTLNKLTGNIIMNGAALASATTVNFVLTNSFIGANDFVDINHTSAGTLGAYGFAVTPANGSATIFIRNNTNASLSEAIAIKFMVFKAAIS